MIKGAFNAATSYKFYVCVVIDGRLAAEIMRKRGALQELSRCLFRPHLQRRAF